MPTMLPNVSLPQALQYETLGRDSDLDNQDELVLKTRFLKYVLPVLITSNYVLSLFPDIYFNGKFLWQYWATRGLSLNFWHGA